MRFRDGVRDAPGLNVGAEHSTAAQRVELPRERPLIPGILVRRYQRFLADVRLDGDGDSEEEGGEIVTAHCVNTGAMEGLTEPGNRVWLSEADNPRRRTRYTWELVEAQGRIYGANTAEPNRLVGRLLQDGHLPFLGAWAEVRAEVGFAGRRRVDFLLRGSVRSAARERLLEVKNCHLLYPDGRAYFPDSRSERASHHLEALAGECTEYRDAAVLFVCQMTPVRAVRPSDAHDPVFAETARRVRRAGVRFFAISIEHRIDCVRLIGRVPVDLRPYDVRRVQRWRAQS